MRRPGTWRRIGKALHFLTIAVLGVAPGCADSNPSAPSAPEIPSFSGVTLKVAALRDATILQGLATHRGEWSASRHGEIEIEPEPIRALDSLSKFSLLIFPGQDLGNLVDADVLEPIPNAVVLPPEPAADALEAPRRARTADNSAADPFQYRDIASAFREQATKYGSERLALPLGSSALVLVYRRDAFQRPANVEAARSSGLTLEPPSTWDQLDALGRFFQGRDWNGDGKPDQGIAAVLGQDPEGVGETIFLARSASLGQHRDHYSFLFDSDALKPRIDAPPFAESLRAIVSWKSLGPAGIEAFDAAAARQAFRDGKAAMLIDRAEKALAWSGGSPVGVAPLPGSQRVYEPMRNQWDMPDSPNRPTYLPQGGGWLVGVKRGLSDRERAAALDLAAFLAGPENVNRLRAERSFPMLPVRSAQMGQGLPDPTSAPDVDARHWSDAVSRTLMAERVVIGLRIPEAAGYLEDLAKGRVAALGGKDPAAALRDVAAAWEGRTKGLGQGHQLWHYRRSLNSLPTLPQPPARGK
jgi:multiple sugar transport system substrate-binding protein